MSHPKYQDAHLDSLSQMLLPRPLVTTRRVWLLTATRGLIAVLACLTSPSCDSKKGNEIAASEAAGATASGGSSARGATESSSGEAARAGTTSNGRGGAPAAAGDAGHGTGSAGRSGSVGQTGGVSPTAGAAGMVSAGSVSAGAGIAGTSGSSASGECPATANAAPGETTQSVMVGGMMRSFIRHVPRNYTGKTPVPVVIDFHPLGGSGSSWKNSAGWGNLADKEGFIVVWPDGIDGSWNAGRCCRSAFDQKIDDVGFTRAIIASLSHDACIDEKRVYATGCSNGGGMAFKLACDAADVIAAVAPVDFDCVTSADASDRSCGSTCAKTRPISEIQFRGANDTVVPIAGGIRSGGTTTFPGAQETFMSYGMINMCTGTPAPLPDHPACLAYPMCREGVETALCTVPNGTHCGSYQSFGIVNIAWEVFRGKSLP